jgi:hypothetical protein
MGKHFLAKPYIAKLNELAVSEVTDLISTSAKVQIDYTLRYAHTRTRAAHSKLPVDPCATRSL